jgi:predicted O-linked N-acetylglucosamine transferase (SPINDLY family)/Tfp pilus assembly protein PilF
MVNDSLDHENVHGAAEAFNTANAAWRKSEWVEALQWYQQAARLNPSLANAHLGMARCFVKLADWPEAREAFAACLRLDPEQYSAWLEAGHLCRQMGQFSQALGAYKRATEVSPNRYEAYFALGRLLPEMGEPLQGEQAFERSMDCLRASKEPTAIWRQAEALHRMGQYRLEQGDAKQALVLLQRGLSLLAAIEKSVQSQTIASGMRQQDLDHLRVEMHIDLGDAYWRLGQKPMAFKAFTLASASHSEVSLSRLGALSFRLNLWQEAIQVLQRNVALHPQRLTARWNLAHLLAECWQMDAAETALREAEAIGPVPGAKSLRASMAGRRGDADRALQLYQECAADAAEHGAFASAAAMSSLYSDQLSAEEVAQLHRRLFSSLGEGAKASADFKYPSHKGRRLKLGMVTADFHHQHPVNLFMQPVLRALDRDRIELFVYFNGVSYDEQTRLAMQRAEHWLECATLNDVQLAKHIEADQIDLLLDLAGHTGQHRMRLFAQRAAPVQATYLGYPGSTGVPNIDWILGDAIVTPKGHESLYSEKIWRLPELVFCFSPEDDYPMDGLFNRKSDSMITFGSFNNVPKLTSKTLTLWARILRAVPNSKLLLKAPSFTDAGAVKLFQARLSQLGVDLQRVEFRGPTGLADMMQEYHDVDIALDPIPYNGGTTSLQALWMGVPVVVLEGAHFVSRMGASFMTAARLPEWIAEDEDDYVRIAAQMAMDRPKLKELKRGLRARLQALPGWDPARQTRSLEEAFVGMCHQNLKPR